MDLSLANNYVVEEEQSIITLQFVRIRTNDDDDKLVVMANDKNYSIEQISALVEFQEMYYTSEIYFEEN